jgi:hypothetical protein
MVRTTDQGLAGVRMTIKVVATLAEGFRMLPISVVILLVGVDEKELKSNNKPPFQVAPMQLTYDCVENSKNY